MSLRSSYKFCHICKIHFSSNKAEDNTFILKVKLTFSRGMTSVVNPLIPIWHWFNLQSIVVQLEEWLWGRSTNGLRKNFHILRLLNQASVGYSRALHAISWCVFNQILFYQNLEASNVGEVWEKVVRAW